MAGTPTYITESKHHYPLTKMNFLVSVGKLQGVAAFSEVTGIDSTVDVIEFRQGNAASMAPMKIPGLVKHSNITLKFGFTKDSTFKLWIDECVKEQRGAIDRQNVTIELIDIIPKTPANVSETITNTAMCWILKNAWVAKYTGPDLNSMTSEIAIESVELAYEELELAKGSSAASN